MAIDPHTSPGGTGNPGYETRDANVTSLLKFGLWMALILISIGFGMKWMFGYFAHTQNLGPAVSPFENTRTLPPLPRLQTTPQKDIHDYWEAEQDELNSYGWVDRQNGIVRIPIDRAMRLVLERGLPARAGGKAPEETPNSAAPIDQGRSAGGTQQ